MTERDGSKLSERAKSLEEELAEIQKTTESRGAAAKAAVDATLAQFLDDDDDQTTGMRNLREKAAQEGWTMPPGEGSPGDTQPSMPAVRLEDESTGPSTQRPKLDAHTPRTEHVLVVDDEPDIRDTLAQILTEEGYDVRTAGDGAEALFKALRSTVLPDLILLDIGLPYVTGLEVKAALEAVMLERQLPPIPILFITAANPERLPPDIRRDYVFTKPLKLERLLEEAHSRINEGRLVRHSRKATP